MINFLQDPRKNSLNYINFIQQITKLGINIFDYNIRPMEYKEDSTEPHIEKRFQKIQKIGSGAYGYVWKVKDKSTEQIFALKKIFLAFQNDVDAQRTYRQIAILRQMNHPNIIKLKQVIRAQNELDLYLVFQYVECDLFNAIRDGVLNQIHKKYIIFQLAKALLYLHSAGVLHRDLKPSNVLIDSNCKVKICDFGLSRTLYKYDNQQPNMTQFIATRWYRAPQVLFGSKTYSYKSDMWSLGCLIFELFASRPLLPGNDSVNQIEKVLQLKGFPTMQQMEHLDVDKIDVLLSHFKTSQLPETHYFKPTWNSKLVKLLRSLLQYSPRKRWTPQEVMNCEFVEQFHNYQQATKAKSAIMLRVSDNTKNDKNFYRNFINRFFIKKSAANALQKPLIRLNRSQSPRKRLAETSTRKKYLKDSSMSLHNFQNKSQVHKIFSKTKPRTIHYTVRNSSQSKHKPSRYKNKENVTPKKNVHRKLVKENRKSVHKQQSIKKILKKRAVVFNI